MPSTSNTRDISLHEPKVSMTMKKWELDIGPTIIGGEVHWLLHSYIGCSKFNLNLK
jgi:hypothetical protein